MAALLRGVPAQLKREGSVTTRDYDEWTIDRWRLEPKLGSLELDDSPQVEQAPPLWKDLTLAVVVALGLWVVVVILFGR